MVAIAEIPELPESPVKPPSLFLYLLHLRCQKKILVLLSIFKDVIMGTPK